MNFKRLILAFTITCTFVSACGKNSPTAPTPPVANNPPPVVAPPTPPPVAVNPTLTFTPQSSNVTGRALAVQVATRGQEAGKIALAIAAYNLSDVVRVRGTIRWDPNVLDYDAWGEGDWFKQGGALVDWTHFTNSPGEFVLFIERPTTLPGAVGSGEIILVRLRAKAGVRGSSPIQWSEPAIYPSVFRQLPLDNVYGGTITVQ